MWPLCVHSETVVDWVVQLLCSSDFKGLRVNLDVSKGLKGVYLSKRAQGVGDDLGID